MLVDAKGVFRDVKEKTFFGPLTSLMANLTRGRVRPRECKQV